MLKIQVSRFLRFWVWFIIFMVYCKKSKTQNRMLKIQVSGLLVFGFGLSSLWFIVKTVKPKSNVENQVSGLLVFRVWFIIFMVYCKNSKTQTRMLKIEVSGFSLCMLCLFDCQHSILGFRILE